jgi:Lon-like protease
VLGAFVVLVAITVIGASVITVPYYGIAPGEARPSEQRVAVEGVETYAADGEVLFVTVSVPHLTALGAFLGWLDPDTDVVHEDLILGDQTPQENRQENLALMGASKDTATYVALKELGYPVELSGGGAVVQAPVPEAPAAKFLQAEDVITAIDGQPIHLVQDIARALEGKQAGDVVTVTVDRLDVEEMLTFEIPLWENPDDGRVILGITPSGFVPATLQFTFPFPIEIDSGSVGGPSAGLAFTLALLDTLTPGELTGGDVVAATGEIYLDGSVGAIGGIRQKTVAVEATDAQVFLVPKQNEAIAREEAKGSDLKVVGVSTLDEALTALDAEGGNADALGTPGASFQPGG